ncbi:MAG: phenylalanine--tRNA ligase subunit beta [Phycisphaerae bacterium]
MKISLNWLTDYVEVTMAAGELGDLMTSIGLNCDGVAQTASDIVFTFDVTSNRPDWLGHIGVAREVAAATGAAFKPPAIGNLPTRGRASELTSVEVRDPVLCPRYTARIIRGVKVAPSPRWLVERLEAVGLRGVNNIVDITNYVLFEYSQPLHCFDYDKLDGRRIIVRRAANGETMVSIDGTRCDLTDKMLVIADASRPVAIAGVMGGLNTEVTESTTNVLIESAQFDPLTTRRTSRKLGIMSESNYRFERGVDPVGVDQASLRACQLILELAGGELAEGMVDVWAKPYVAPKVALRPARTDAILGMKVPPQRQKELLARLGLAPELDAKTGRIVCTVPSFRGDITREIDLIEEVARLEGYGKVAVGGQVTHAVRPEGLNQRTRRQVGAVLAAGGFDEAVTFTFIDREEAALFGEPAPMQADPIVRKTNNALRPTVLPSLLRSCKTNQDAGNGPVSLFELAAVFPPGGAGGPDATGPVGLPLEHVELGLVTTRDLRVLRGVVEAVVAQVAPDAKVDVRHADAPGFGQGASAEVLLDGSQIGMIGPISQAARSHYGLEHDLTAGRLDFDALLAKAGKVRQYRPIPRFPAVRRDLSLIVDDAVTWRELDAAITAIAQPLREALEYVTTYRGKPIPDGRKSVTVTLVYRSPDGTLRSEQVDEQVSQVVEAMKRKMKAELRT